MCDSAHLGLAMEQVTRVPPAGGVSSFSEPPIALARYFMMSRPIESRPSGSGQQADSIVGNGEQDSVCLLAGVRFESVRLPHAGAHW